MSDNGQSASHPKEDYEQVLAVVSACVAQASGQKVESISTYADLIDDLNMDSLALFEVVVDLETHYNMRIPDESVDALRCIEDIVQFILRQLH